MTEDRSRRLVVAAGQALRERQHAAREQLMRGFESRTEILLWQHEVAACTLGRIDDDWQRSILSDRWLTSALLADASDREAMTSYAPGSDAVSNVKLDIYQDDLLPASQSAIKWFWRKTTEYAGENKTPVDPSKQKFLAMRPRLDEHVITQRRALLWALDEPPPGGESGLAHDGPIEDRQGLLEWVELVVYATNGAVDESFGERVATPMSEWWRPLLVSRGPLLELLLADDVLPAMNRSIREAAETAAEFPAEEREKVTIPSG